MSNVTRTMWIEYIECNVIELNYCYYKLRTADCQSTATIYCEARARQGVFNVR